MVLKHGKGNINTGGTLRSLSGKHQHCYSRQAVVSKVLEVTSPEQAFLPRDAKAGYIFESRRDAIDDGNLESTGMNYSLNKKGRWKLAELLKDKITPRSGMRSGPETEDPEDYNVTLLEHHKLRKQATCIGAHSTRLENRSVTPKAHAYFNEKTVFNRGGKTVSNKRKRRLRQQHLQQQEEDVEPEPEVVARQPEIRYSLLYPTPATSAISRSAKHTMDNQLLFPEDVEHQTSFQSRHSKRNRAGKNGSHSATMDDYWDDVYEMEDADEDCEEEYMRWAEEDGHFDLPLAPTFTVALQGLLTEKDANASAKKVQKKALKRRHNSDNDQDDKDAHIVVIHAKPKIQPPQKQATQPAQPVTCPVTVEIATPDINKGLLQGKFGMTYSEASCWPRTFALDVSSDVMEHFRLTKLYPAEELLKMELTSFLVYQIHNESVERGTSTASIGLECKLQEINTVQLETLHDQACYTVEETIAACCRFLSMLPNHCFTTSEHNLPKYTSKVKLVGKRDVVHQAVGCQMEAMLPQVAYNERSVTEVSQKDIVVDSSWTTVCGICYEECSASADGVPRATAMLPCQHWFCNDCWKTHLKTQMSTTMNFITCPEFNCKSVISPTMVLAFLGLNSYQTSLQNQHNITLSMMPSLYWCPNPICGLVVLPEEGSNMVVEQRMLCPCGKDWCSQCQSEAHWPASCDQAREHMDLLKKNGDVDVRPEGHVMDVVVGVKRCPHCRQLFNKISGCPFMQCVCQKAFCWDCLGPWDTTTWRHECPVNKKKQKIVPLQNITIFHEEKRTKSRSRSYLRSREHRKRHHPKMANYLRHHASILASRLLKSKHMGTESSKLVMSAPSSVIQLHQVCEYTIVLLQTRRAGPMVHCLHRMEQIASQMEQLLESGESQALKLVHPRLCSLLDAANQAVQELATFCPHLNNRS